MESRTGRRPSAAPTGTWVSMLRPAGADRVRGRVLVLPHSGAGPHALYPVVRGLPDDVEVLGVTGPGREGRAGEPVPDLPDAHAVVERIVAESAARPTRPTVLFGHSMGAALAAAIAARPAGSALAGLCGAVLSACPARRAPAGACGGDEEILRIVALGGGTPPAVLASRVWREHLVALMRHDLAITLALSPAEDLLRIEVPTTVLTGRDDPLVDAAALPAPGPRTRRRALPGGHFYLLEEGNTAAVAAEILDRLDP